MKKLAQLLEVSGSPQQLMAILADTVKTAEAAMKDIKHPSPEFTKSVGAVIQRVHDQLDSLVNRLKNFF